MKLCSGTHLSMSTIELRLQLQEVEAVSSSLVLLAGLWAPLLFQKLTYIEDRVCTLPLVVAVCLQEGTPCSLAITDTICLVPPVGYVEVKASLHCDHCDVFIVCQALTKEHRVKLLPNVPPTEFIN